MSCATCEQEGKPRTSYFIFMRYTPLYREDGTYRYHDPDLPVRYECQNGHHWEGPEDQEDIDHLTGAKQRREEERLKEEHATIRAFLKRYLKSEEEFALRHGGQMTDAELYFEIEQWVSKHPAP